MKGRSRRPRDRAKATMHTVLDLTPEQQFARERGDPFPPHPGWTEETLAAVSDKPAPYDGRNYRVRRPVLTPADEAAAQYVGGFTQRLWALARAGRFGEARRLALQWGTPRGPQHSETGPQPGIPPYAPPGSVTAAVSLPSIPVRRPLPPMALAPVRERRNAVARHRLDRLRDDPPCEHPEQWAARMRSVGLATGTHTQWEDAVAWPAADAGDPVPVRRGLAITAGLPRRQPGARTGRHAAAGTTPAGQQPPAPWFRDVDTGLLTRVRDRLANLPERRSA